jgi:iron(III) transport system ATP-binding protein
MLWSRSGADARAHADGVVVAGLEKRFGAQPVLQGVDLRVQAGTITAILGPSGSGKTTLLRLLAGLARPDSGSVTIGGTVVDGPGRHVPPESRRVGYVPQEGSLFPHLDVRANVGFGLPRARRRQRVAELLDLTGLGDLAHRYPHQMSGGQQQRVALARALAPDPSLVLLDEPFSSLDAALRTSVRLEVDRILRQAGTTTVMVTHDQDEALAMADQVAVLRDGRVAQAGHPEEVYCQPVDPGLARFLGEANVVTGVIRGQHADTVFGLLPLVEPALDFADGTEVTVLVRPEQISIASADPGESPGGVAGTVVQTDYHGHDSLVAVAVGADTFNVRLLGAAYLQPGTPVGLKASGAVRAWPS